MPSRLYELIALRGNLEHKLTEAFSVNDLRARLGVPEGRLPRWQDFKRKVVETAVSEVNHLSPFQVEWAPTKHGRSVVAVVLTWKRKSGSERIAASREVGRSRLGRKARRAAYVGPSEVVPTFPSSGSIAYSRWAEIVRQHAPSPTPDVDLVAERFRAFANARRLSLTSAAIEKTFTAYASKFRVA